MDQEKKDITIAEIILGVLLTLTVDVIAGLLDLTAVGWVIATPLQAATSGATTLWLLSKGDKRAKRLERQGIKQLANFLPVSPIVVTTFTCSISFIIEVILHKKSLAGGVAEKALSKTS